MFPPLALTFFPALQNSFLPEVVEDLDADGLPLQKLALLHGPPGLGKTTLAHVIARHAGYAVVEMNASDDRSLAAFSSRVDSATQMRALGGDNRPNCLIVDEVDGAPAQAVNYLIGLISGGGGKKGKKKGGGAQKLQRPVICICNDLFVPALRPLRQHAITVRFKKQSKNMLHILRETVNFTFEKCCFRSPSLPLCLPASPSAFWTSPAASASPPTSLRSCPSARRRTTTSGAASPHCSSSRAEEGEEGGP